MHGVTAQRRRFEISIGMLGRALHVSIRTDCAPQDMIAAYKSVKSDACAKCGDCYDADSSRPLARRMKPAAAGNETAEVIWEARHEGCLDS